MDLLAIIRILVSKKHFTMEEYNDALKKNGFFSYESSDKPCPVPQSKSKKISKLSGKAISHWVHIRNWPLIIRRLVTDPSDSVLQLGLKLHEIVERVTAQEFFLYEIDLLEEKIIQYLEMRKNVREEFKSIMPNPKPKHHYMRKIYL